MKLFPSTFIGSNSRYLVLKTIASYETYLHRNHLLTSRRCPPPLHLDASSFEQTCSSSFPSLLFLLYFFVSFLEEVFCFDFVYLFCFHLASISILREYIQTKNFARRPFDVFRRLPLMLVTSASSAMLRLLIIPCAIFGTNRAGS